MMVSNNWARGRTLYVEGVLRNTKGKHPTDNLGERLLSLTYVKAKQCSFGDDRPSQAKLAEMREADYLTPNDDE